MAELLVKLIQQAKSGDKDAMEKLIVQFSPLISKYAEKLIYEDGYERDDAYGDLQLYFIQNILSWHLLKNPTDMQLKSYIQKSTSTSYLILSMQHNHYQRNTDLFSSFAPEQESDQYEMDKRYHSTDSYPELEYGFIHSLLTQHEATIIFLNVILEYPSKEVAKRLGISASAVSQVKSNAIRKLRYYYENLYRGD